MASAHLPEIYMIVLEMLQILLAYLHLRNSTSFAFSYIDFFQDLSRIQNLSLIRVSRRYWALVFAQIPTSKNSRTVYFRFRREQSGRLHGQTRDNVLLPLVLACTYTELDVASSLLVIYFQHLACLLSVKG